MFDRKAAPEETRLEKAIDHAYRELAGHEAHTAQYAQIVDQIVKLHAMLSSDNKTKFRVDANTALVVGGNLLGVFGMLHHERLNVVTSKVMSLLLKPKP